MDILRWAARLLAEITRGRSLHTPATVIGCGGAFQCPLRESTGALLGPVTPECVPRPQGTT